MADERTELVIFADGAGELYELPREIIEGARVSPARRAELEAQLGDDDTAGFLNPQPLPPRYASSTVNSVVNPALLLNQVGIIVVGGRR